MAIRAGAQGPPAARAPEAVRQPDLGRWCNWLVRRPARQFLESARRDDDVLHAAYVLVLVLGLRVGELLGLTWELLSLDSAELYVGEQLQRVGRQLLCSRVKTDASEAPLPLPDLCITARGRNCG
jgi:hypothetical protein